MVFLQLIARMKFVNILSFTVSPPWLPRLLLNPHRSHQDGTPPRDFFFSRGPIVPLKIESLAFGKWLDKFSCLLRNLEKLSIQFHFLKFF